MLNTAGFFCEFLHFFLQARNTQDTFAENPHMKQFKETKTFISYSYLIRQRFQGYRFKSGIAIFSWRITLNYAYSPFNLDGVNLQYFKLRLFDLYRMHSCKYWRSTTLCCKDIRIRKCKFLSWKYTLWSSSGVNIRPNFIFNSHKRPSKCIKIV